MKCMLLCIANKKSLRSRQSKALLLPPGRSLGFILFLREFLLRQRLLGQFLPANIPGSPPALRHLLWGSSFKTNPFWVSGKNQTTGLSVWKSIKGRLRTAKSGVSAKTLSLDRLMIWLYLQIRLVFLLSLGGGWAGQKSPRLVFLCVAQKMFRCNINISKGFPWRTSNQQYN